MKPRVAAAPDWLIRARDDFRAARFTSAAEKLDLAVGSQRVVTPEAFLLRARIALKSDPAAALAYLTRHRAAFHASRDRASATMLRGAAYARLGDFTSSNAAFRDASATLGANDPLQLEIAYRRAFALWMARKLDAAERTLAPVEEHATGDLAIEARQLHGLILGSRGNIAAQGAILLEMLTALRAPGVRVLDRGIIASQFASLACELPSPALRDAANAEVAMVPWTPDMAETQFDALRELAWCDALQGDHFNAFRRLKAAAAVAPTAAWRTLSLCDRAYLADAFGERRWAAQELRDATELAETVIWHSTRGEERFALSLLAELYAPRDPSLALTYVARYQDTAGGVARVLSSHDDRRVDAMEAYSAGIVRRALGETAEALRLIRSAWDIYDAIGYDWRAGRAALALAELTGVDAWRTKAAEKLRPYGRSWLVAPNQPNLADVPEISRLTGAQRTVLDLIVQGKPTAEIAAELGRSEFTIRNHIKSIFKTIGVNTRPALIARITGTAR